MTTMRAPVHGAGLRTEDPPDNLSARLTAALRRIDAPDVVVAASVNGRRAIVSGGGRPEPVGPPRTERRYEVGSVTKTFTGLLLADLAAAGLLGVDDPLTDHLPRDAAPPARRAATRGPITLRHLATHTSGLPRLPPDLLLGAFVRPNHNAYADYTGERLLRAFARTRLRSAPGRRWHYSNFGVALLGQALCRTSDASYPDLLAARVLRPLGLHCTTALPAGSGDAGTDAVGHTGYGITAVPRTGMGSFAPAAAARATPGDLLTYAEAHLAPGAGPLAAALRAVCATQLEHGRRRPRVAHTLGWFQHPAPHGPLLFHPGATFGQQAFLGLHPASGAAVVALATRRGRSTGLVPTAYDLLHTLAGTGDLRS